MVDRWIVVWRIGDDLPNGSARRGPRSHELVELARSIRKLQMRKEEVLVKVTGDEAAFLES